MKLAQASCAHCAKPFHGTVIDNGLRDLYAAGQVDGWTSITVGPPHCSTLILSCSKPCSVALVKQLNLHPTPELTRP